MILILAMLCSGACGLLIGIIGNELGLDKLTQYVLSVIVGIFWGIIALIYEHRER